MRVDAEEPTDEPDDVHVAPGARALNNELADMAASTGAAWRSSRAASREAIRAAIDAGVGRNQAGYCEWGPFLDRTGTPVEMLHELRQAVELAEPEARRQTPGRAT